MVVCFVIGKSANFYVLVWVFCWGLFCFGVFWNGCIGWVCFIGGKTRSCLSQLAQPESKSNANPNANQNPKRRALKEIVHSNHSTTTTQKKQTTTQTTTKPARKHPFLMYIQWFQYMGFTAFFVRYLL